MRSRNDRAHYGRRGKAQPLAKHLRLEQKCARRTLTVVERTDDSECHCREAEAPVQGRFRGSTFRGVADRPHGCVVLALPAQLPCEVCGVEAVDAHHDQYDEPLRYGGYADAITRWLHH